MSMSRTVARLVGVVKRYGASTILDGLDFTLSRGDLLALNAVGLNHASAWPHLLVYRRVAAAGPAPAAALRLK